MSMSSGEHRITEKTNIGKTKLVIELIVAILLSVCCALMGMSNLLFASNADYPYTVDGFGHMTKVVYIAGQLAQGHIPSWFPYWYNNSTTTQYYVPLSYYIMAPIYMITNNVMLTYKIFCASVMAIGAFGVWVTCYKKIGRVCGLFGIVIFCFQPLLLDSLYESGVIAQGPIIALMSWYFLSIFSCAEKPKKSSYIASTLLMTMMILSHAMHAFMIFLTTGLVLFLFLIFKKINFRNLFVAGTSVVFAAILTAFWSLVGSTQLENEGVPYLLPESSYTYTANINWYFPEKAIFYFSLVTTAYILIAALISFIKILSKKNSKCDFFANAAILLSIVTIIFSFGMNLPGFQYLPMAKSIVAGRILTYTSVTSAIAAAYVIKSFWRFPKAHLFIRPFLIIAIIASVWVMQPYAVKYSIIPEDYYNSTAQYLKSDISNFDKGRYQWYAAIVSSEAFFPVQYDYNLSDGWNIEGTVHNQELWNNNIALSVGDDDYTIKQIAFWNVRYLLVYNRFQSLVDKLFQSDLGFYKATQREEGGFYISDKPSSYYLLDSRNAMVISTSTQGFSIEYPNFIQGKSANISKYSLDELTKYKLVYIIEPELNTLSQRNELESKITQMVNAGIDVIIEPAATNNFELFGVNTRDENYQSTPSISPTEGCPFDITGSELTGNSNISVIRTLHGLDETYMNLTFQGSTINNAIMGTKKVGNGKVIFLGAHLSQYLKPVYARNFGLEMLDDTIKENSSKVQAIFDSIFDYYGVEENYLPQNYNDVINHKWNYQGGEFTYQSDEDREVTLSVSYSPRWSATLDGSKIQVGQCENLITLILPSGEHTVKLHYGITIYGMIGYIISAAGALIFLLFLILWKWNMKAITYISNKLAHYLQIEKPSPKTNELSEDNESPEGTEEMNADNPEESLLEGINTQEPMESEETIQNMSSAASEFAATVTAVESEELSGEPDLDDKAVGLSDPDEISLSDRQEVEQEEAPFKLYHTVHENGVMVEVIEIDEEEEPVVEDSMAFKVIEKVNYSLPDKEQELENQTKAIPEEVVPEAAESQDVILELAVAEEVVSVNNTSDDEIAEIDYDKIIKKARYESQRRWLTDYYETLIKSKRGS